MTRIIKFRVWSKAYKAMMEPKDPLVAINTSNGELFGIVDGKYAPLNSDNYELMQFTGLLDKNGKEIYEGDVVKFYKTTLPDENDEDEAIPMVCKFAESSFGFYGDGDSMTGALSNSDKDFREIIGNIYESPALLSTPN